MCRRAASQARKATIKTARFASRCVVWICKSAVVAHALATLVVVASLCLSQHHTTSKYTVYVEQYAKVYAEHCLEPHFHASGLVPYLSYAHTHLVFPWVVVIAGSHTLCTARGMLTHTWRRLRNRRQPSAPAKYAAATEEKELDKPPRGVVCKPKTNLTTRPGGKTTYSKKKQKHRLYPTIQSFKLHDT